MMEVNPAEPPEFLSDHPSSDSRITRLSEELPSALAEYEKAQAAGRKPIRD
jgi:hypothetical protein